MAGGRSDYGSMRSEDPFRNPNQFDQELNKIRTKVADIRTFLSQLEGLFRKLNSDGGATAGVRSQVLSLENRINETIDSTNLLLRNLNSYHVEDRILQSKAAKIRRDFEAVIRKYRDLTKAISEMMKTLSLASAEDGLLVDTGDTRALVPAQEQRNIEADLALQLHQEEEIERLTGDVVRIEEMFQDLQGQVHEQTDAVDSLYNNMEDARTNVEVANQQLSSAVVYKRKVRKRCVCIVVIVLVAAGILALVIYLATKK